MAGSQTPWSERRRSPTTPSITSVGRSHQEDIDARMLKYGITMGIRIACFGLIFVLDGPWRWVAAVGAILLPYVAVLIANAGRERLPVSWGTGRSPRDVPSPHRDEPEVAPAALRPVQVVRGETVERESPAGSGAAGRVPTRDRDGDGPPGARAS